MQTPLANEMRPKTLKDIVGQQHLIAPNKPIWLMVQAKRLTSMILYGAPGIGKTSIASAIANTMSLDFMVINASTASKKDLQLTVDTAKKSAQHQIVLLIDEIHRLDKIKQDFLLSYMEDGTLIVIGATTENPYISINPAIRSRAQIFELKPVSNDDLKIVAIRAIKLLETKVNQAIPYEETTLNFLVNSANGDVRTLLNTIEIVVLGRSDHQLNPDTLQDFLNRSMSNMDKNGDGHYNTISALQKSIRGSDVDAALHYAAIVMDAGDLPILVRRLTVIAYEDIGLADPTTATQAMMAINTAKSIGLPEARISLSFAIIILALAYKSNRAYLAIDNALENVQQGYGTKIPKPLSDTHYKNADKLGNGIGYKYSHDYPNDWVAQQFLPDDLNALNVHYLANKATGEHEQALLKRYHQLKDAQNNFLKGKPNE